MNKLPDLKKVHIPTERLLIRNITTSDHTAYFMIFGNPNIALYDDFLPITEKDAVQNVTDIIANYEANYQEQEFAVALIPENTAIGILYMRHEMARILIGYHFNESYQGKGYAIEAVKAFINWISGNYDQKIEALVDYQNLPSIKLLQKTGFQFQTANNDELVFELPHKPFINEDMVAGLVDFATKEETR